MEKSNVTRQILIVSLTVSACMKYFHVLHIGDQLRTDFDRAKIKLAGHVYHRLLF